MEDVFKTIIWCVTGIIVFITVIFASSKGWLKTFKLSKTGFEYEGSEIRQKQSGSLNKLLDDKITEIDMDIKLYAIKIANALYDNLMPYLGMEIQHLGARRIIAGAVRQALYNIQLMNNFKIVLRPENFKSFISGVMKNVQTEYEEAIRDQKYYTCPIHGGGCFEYPKFIDIIPLVRERITHDWAFPLRNYQILSHEKKISLYQQFIPSFQELGDKVKVNTTQECIDKNIKYKEALERKPEGDEL